MCLASKHNQTLFSDQTFYPWAKLFGVAWSCLVVFHKILKAIVQTFDQVFSEKLLSTDYADVIFSETFVYSRKQLPIKAINITFTKDRHKKLLEFDTAGTY